MCSLSTHKNPQKPEKGFVYKSIFGLCWDVNLYAHLFPLRSLSYRRISGVRTCQTITHFLQQHHHIIMRSLKPTMNSMSIHVLVCSFWLNYPWQWVMSAKWTWILVASCIIYKMYMTCSRPMCTYSTVPKYAVDYRVHFPCTSAAHVHNEVTWCMYDSNTLLTHK